MNNSRESSANKWQVTMRNCEVEYSGLSR